MDSSGVIVTNLHVLRGESVASIKLANGDIYDEIAVVDVDERRDLLVIKIKAFGLTPAVLGNSDDIGVGDRIIVLGSPQGLETTLSDGLISAIRDSGDGYRLLQTNAAVSPGSSGGGMFNERGELIGVVAMKIDSGENLNFGIPINYVRGLLSTRSRMTLQELAVEYPVDSNPEAPESTGVTEATSSGEQNTSARIGQLIAEAGFVAVEEIGNGWQISFNGNNLDQVNVDLNPYRDFVLTQSAVPDSSPLTAQQTNRILKLNFVWDLVKAAVNSDDIVVVMNETELRLLDADGLGNIVNEVALRVDELAGELAGVLVSSHSIPSVATESIDVLNGRVSLSFDPLKWTELAPAPEGWRNFIHSAGDGYAQFIVERIEIPTDQLRVIALQNAREGAEDLSVLEEERRIVNGGEVLMMHFEGTSQGIPMGFLGYYYGGPAGTVQLLTWTGRNIFAELRTDFEDFLNGLQVRE